MKLLMPARMLTGSQQKSRSTRGSKSTTVSPGSVQVRPACLRGLLKEGVYSRTQDAEWFCIVAYSRLSEDAQDLDKFLCDMFLEKVKDATVREVCQCMLGGRFTEAYITWVVLTRANPRAQVIDMLNKTKLLYQSVDQLAALMLKCKEAVMNTTTDQRLCWEALRVLTKGIESERDSETKQALS